MNNFKISKSITNRQDESLKAYFRDISCKPMISSEEEIKLAKRVKEGDEEATNKLIEANLRFVISVAKQYQNKGLSLVDLIQEGNLGLIESAKKYNPLKGVRFISYAIWWIRQSILKALSYQCRTVRVPISQIIIITKVAKAIEQFEQDNNRKPSIDELHEITELDYDKLCIALDAINRSVSLDSPIKDEDSSFLVDTIPDNNVADTDYDLCKQDLSDTLNKILSKLSYRDRDIIRMSFGIGMTPLPSEEIAKRFGIGGERVRQIQHSALNKLKTRYGKSLKDLL